MKKLETKQVEKPKKSFLDIVLMGVKALFLTLIGVGAICYLAYVRNMPHIAYLLEDNTVDVAFIGTSRMIWGVEPRYFDSISGFSSVNLGKEQLSATGCFYRLKELFRKQSPKLVVIDFISILRLHGEFAQNEEHGALGGDTAQYRAMNNHFFCELPLGENRFKAYEELDVNPLFDILFGRGGALYNTVLGSADSVFIREKGWRESWINQGGYINRDGKKLWVEAQDYSQRYYCRMQTIDSSFVEYERDMKKTQKKYMDSVCANLEKLLRLCNENGAELLVLHFPMFRSLNQYAKQFYYVKSRYPQVKFVNIAHQREVKINRWDFTNDVHVNTQGGRKILDFLSEYIKIEYAF